MTEILRHGIEQTLLHSEAPHPSEAIEPSRPSLGEFTNALSALNRPIGSNRWEEQLLPIPPGFIQCWPSVTVAQASKTATDREKIEVIEPQGPKRLGNEFKASSRGQIRCKFEGRGLLPSSWLWFDCDKNQEVVAVKEIRRDADYLFLRLRKIVAVATVQTFPAQGL